MTHGITDDDLATIQQASASDKSLGNLLCRSGNPSDDVTAAACRELREAARDGASSYALADDTGLAHGTVRKHLRGKCSHDGGLRYESDEGDYVNGEWVEK